MRRDPLANIFNKKKFHFDWLVTISLVLLIIYAISLLAPLLWALMTSFKDPTEFRINPIGFPKEFAWNYGTVFEKFLIKISTPEGIKSIYIEGLLLNTILYSVGCALAATMVPCFTAYVCARYHYKFSKVVFTTVLVVMVIPIIGSLPSEIKMAIDLGLYDQIWGLWLMKANFLGMYFLVFYAMFKSFPAAFTEAAKIDGAGNFRIMFRVILPLVSTTFFTIFLINFITYWNDYQTPLIYLPHYPTLSLGMYSMSISTAGELSSIPMKMAAAVMLFLPILILYIIFHKKMLGSLTLGGVKG